MTLKCLCLSDMLKLCWRRLTGWYGTPPFTNSDVNQYHSFVQMALMLCFRLQEEVEMEDIAEGPFLDIDNGDKKNPLAVVEYIDDLYKFYRKAEVISCSVAT